MDLLHNLERTPEVDELMGLSGAGYYELAEDGDWDNADALLKYSRKTYKHYGGDWDNAGGFQRFLQKLRGRTSSPGKMKLFLEARAKKSAKRKTLKGFMKTPDFIAAWGSYSEGKPKKLGAKKAYAETLYERRNDTPTAMEQKALEIEVPVGVSIERIEYAAEDYKVAPSQIADAINTVAKEKGIKPAEVKKEDVKKKIDESQPTYNKVFGMPKMVAYPIFIVAGLGFVYGMLKGFKVIK